MGAATAAAAAACDPQVLQFNQEYASASYGDYEPITAVLEAPIQPSVLQRFEAPVS